MFGPLEFILAGVLVGFCVGITGVGGGSSLAFSELNRTLPLVLTCSMPQFQNFVVHLYMPKN